MAKTLIELPKIGQFYSNNSYQLMGLRVKDSGDMYGLFYIPDNSSTPFATWFIGNTGKCNVTRQFDGKGFCWGHYFKDIVEAGKDLEERAGK